MDFGIVTQEWCAHFFDANAIISTSKYCFVETEVAVTSEILRLFPNVGLLTITPHFY